MLVEWSIYGRGNKGRLYTGEPQQDNVARVAVEGQQYWSLAYTSDGGAWCVFESIGDGPSTTLVAYRFEPVSLVKEPGRTTWRCMAQRARKRDRDCQAISVLLRPVTDWS